MNSNELNRLLMVLVAQPKEAEWLEFKANFHSEEEIGEKMSALSNSACLLDKSYGYLVYGVVDKTHDIVGTSFKAKMTKRERVVACYQHACLKYVSNETMSNQSLRQRFAVDAKNYPMISRLLKEAMEANLIKEANPEDKNPKTRGYIPYWG